MKKSINDVTDIEVSEAMKAMQTTKGWRFLVEIVEENIKFMEDSIISGREDGEILEADDLEKLRSRRLFMREFIDKPERLRRMAEMVEEQEIEADPFYKKTEDIVSDRKKQKL